MTEKEMYERLSVVETKVENFETVVGEIKTDIREIKNLISGQRRNGMVVNLSTGVSGGALVAGVVVILKLLGIG